MDYSKIISVRRGLAQLFTNPIPIGWFVHEIDTKPTVFQPPYRSANGWIDGWFRENQPRSNHRI